MSERRGPDVAAIRAKARDDWEQRRRKRRPIQERLGNSVPWWLVIVAAVFFALSIPHTMAVFGQLTPVLGYLAPFGVEFGLLYFAFHRKQQLDRKQKVSLMLWCLGILLFLVAIIVNGAGSLQAVVSNTESVQGLSMNQLWHQFGALSATNQVALLLVPFAALIIPIGTVVAGEGLAGLFLEQREQEDVTDEDWAVVAPEQEFYALRDAAVQMGARPDRAIRWASGITGFRPTVYLSVREPTDTPAVTDTRRTVEQGDSEVSDGQRHMDARTIARQYLEEHPELIDELSARKLASTVGIGKSVAAEILADVRGRHSSSNGHGMED